MTILAYQTLYESSIAYGMRKAMQAEQSKAEQLNKLASLQQIIYEQDDTISRLKQRIIDMLEEEAEDKIACENRHKEDTMSLFEVNMGKCKELQSLLMKINGV